MLLTLQRLTRRAAGLTLASLLVAAITAATAATASTPPVRAPHVVASTHVAVLNDDTEAFNRPSRSSGSAGEVNEVRPITGERTILPVIGRATQADGTAWLDVLLPGRPDSHTGWIEAAYVTPAVTHWQITVDLATRTVEVFDRGRLVQRFLAVVGKASTPTPVGHFFVEETVPLGPDASGAPFALALSARSNALKQYDGGPGQIAFHGVANIGGVPGTAVSHGCIRLATQSISWLGTHISSGVPVTIYA